MSDYKVSIPQFHIAHGRLGDEEFSEAWTFSNGLSELYEYCDRFAVGLTTIIASNEFPRPDDNRWRKMGQRYAAMSVFNCLKAMELLQRQVKHIPAVAALADQEAMSTAIGNIRRLFPDADEMRHAVAHEGELTATHRRFRSNSIKSNRRKDGVFGSLFRPDGLFVSGTFDDAFVMTTQSKEVSVVITPETFMELKSEIDLFCSGFPTLDEARERARGTEP